VVGDERRRERHTFTPSPPISTKGEEKGSFKIKKLPKTDLTTPIIDIHRRVRMTREL